MTKPWKKLSSKVVFENNWMKVRLDQVIDPVGRETDFGIVEKEDYGLIIPKVEDKFYLVNEYRLSVDARSWAFPQGHFEGDKSIAHSALRELEEETGLIAKELKYLGQLYLAPGFCTQKFSVYIAEDCKQSEFNRDLTEIDMKVGSFSFDKLRKMIKDGEVKDSPTVAAFGLYLLSQNS
ncbi:MAG: NUDIX hydrolase [Candidatus Curtissbacteria bacterium]|nr:NUDIX hydrolase [Candidatus Curtissbacteria bacterium]